MSLSPEVFTKALSDLTRLRILLLLQHADELCVCDLMDVLQLEQPKISRHLAMLRNAGVVSDRRAGQWIHYRLHADLPGWSRDALAAIDGGAQTQAPFADDLLALRQRPEANAQVCLS